MPATPSDLFAFLDRLGLAHQTVTHPALFTVEQSRTLRGTIPGGHTKNLFLKDKKGTLFLVTALEDAVIELKSLHRLLGAGGRFSFGSADLMRETLGIEPGAVTPFAAINDTERRVRVVLDAAMMQHANAQLSPAGQHHDHLDCRRGPRAVPGGDRPPAPDRRGGAFRRRPAPDVIRLSFQARAETHHRPGLRADRNPITRHQGRREQEAPGGIEFRHCKHPR